MQTHACCLHIPHSTIHIIVGWFSSTCINICWFCCCCCSCFCTFFFISRSRRRNFFRRRSMLASSVLIMLYVLRKSWIFFFNIVIRWVLFIAGSVDRQLTQILSLNIDEYQSLIPIMWILCTYQVERGNYIDEISMVVVAYGLWLDLNYLHFRSLARFNSNKKKSVNLFPCYSSEQFIFEWKITGIGVSSRCCLSTFRCRLCFRLLSCTSSLFRWTNTIGF